MPVERFLGRMRRGRDAAEMGAPTGPVPLHAFGQSLELPARVPRFLAEDSLWRLGTIYDPALSVRSLPRDGVAVDIGAGFGAFALPFARAFPGWTLWCFEPNPEFFAALERNIAAMGCENVVALNLAVGGDEAQADHARLAAALAARDAAALATLCPQRAYRRDTSKPGFVEAERRPAAGALGPGGSRYPTLPAGALATLEPTLLKLLAPGMEAAILEGLDDVPLDHVIGETWHHVPARLIYDTPGARETWLPVAGAPARALRRAPGTDDRREGLDIVVAMYNARDWIAECVESLTAADDPAIRVRVVDDGSTDGGGELVEERFAHELRVILHRKPNGGCASARNYGRLMSDATHVAFVDSDDVADRELFSQLLELARYTGAEVVQGGFDLLEQDAGGNWHSRPGPEAVDASAPPPNEPLSTMTLMAGTDLMTRQPTIWRRVYRRDFLDNRDIWFPEHIRAFDDLLFQLLSLQHAGEVPTLEHLRLHYRQHPGQDIRQGDERGFYALEMFRLALKRGLQEGWRRFTPLLRSYVNTIDWTYDGLRDDLKAPFLAAAAELWVLMEKALGPEAFGDFPDTVFVTEGFGEQANRVRRRLDGLEGSHAFAWLDSAMMHADILRHMPPRDTAPHPTEPG
ncbi:hypothetical protein C2I36_14675 [Rhodobacteraceae bacterium WD3A24]|nr:hypothetical protein C2I36_14675 [Rhodobacteraceae bacterium WD3A24]